MEQRLATSWRISLNDKNFIETALISDIRIDGRRSFDYRHLSIKFGREDGSSEVKLGHTYVLGFVTSQLVQPYRDRPNEGTLSVYINLSPMADPSFEPGRPNEFAVELGRVIDRGLRESRAVDMESLCVLSGKFVWSVRVDLHILDNGGNLLDTSNIAALAALLTFRRPDCTLGGVDGQEVIVHPPETEEPLPLIVHHLPIAVTFGFISDENLMVIDPTHHEEEVMRGRMTVTINASGDVCAIHKAGGAGVLDSVTMQCLRVASVKAVDMTSKIRKAVESYETERALRKIKRNSSSALVDVGVQMKLEEKKSSAVCRKENELSLQHIEKLKLKSEESPSSVRIDTDEQQYSRVVGGHKDSNFLGAPSRWDPYSESSNSDLLRASFGSSVSGGGPSDTRPISPEQSGTKNPRKQVGTPLSVGEGKRTLQDAVKPKHKRDKRRTSLSDTPKR